MAARRVVVVDVGLAEAFRHSADFGFVAAGLKHWDTVNCTGLFASSEPTGGDCITTNSHTTSTHTTSTHTTSTHTSCDFAGRGFLVESSNRAQRKRAGHKRAW
jgi:hypothetical protein